jgi:hypothetical protein
MKSEKRSLKIGGKPFVFLSGKKKVSGIANLPLIYINLPLTLTLTLPLTFLLRAAFSASVFWGEVF